MEELNEEYRLHEQNVLRNPKRDAFKSKIAGGFCRAYAKEYAHLIDVEHIAEHFEKVCRSGKYSFRYIRDQVSALNHLFNYAVAKNYCAVNPVLGFSVSKFHSLIPQKNLLPKPVAIFKRNRAWPAEIYEAAMNITKVRLDEHLEKVRELRGHMKRKGFVSMAHWGWKRGIQLEKDCISGIEFCCFLLVAMPLSLGTGLRLGDITSLQWYNLLRDGWIVVSTRKTDKNVMIPYSDEAIEQYLSAINLEDEDQKIKLRRCLAESGQWTKIAIANLEFPPECETGEVDVFPVVKSKQEQYSAVSNYFRNLLGRTKLPEIKNYSFHGLRHTFIQRFTSQGIDYQKVGMLVGHSNPKTTEIYDGKPL
jgi:integrase